jgi:hypothetical protein
MSLRPRRKLAELPIDCGKLLSGHCGGGLPPPKRKKRLHTEQEPGIATVGAVTRQLLVETLRAGKGLACAQAICKVWKLAMYD